MTPPARKSGPRGAAAAAPDQVNALAFGDDGTVYVAGQTASTMPGATGSLGGTDSITSKG